MLERNSHFFSPIFAIASMLLLFAGLCGVPAALGAQTTEAAMPEAGASTGGSVELPRETYDRLVAAASDPKPEARPAPVPWALGNAKVTVEVSARDGIPASAKVDVVLDLRVLEDQWSLVPVLPTGTAVDWVIASGEPAQLVASSAGLAWGVKKAGQYTLRMQYRADTTTSDDGYALPLPLPRASSISLEATLPSPDLDVAVIPSAGRRLEAAGSGTKVLATIPTSSGVLLSWRRPSDRSHSISRATYRGRLEGDAVRFRGTFDVELFGNDPITLPLLPQQVTLSRLDVDGAEAAILVEGGYFATVVRGRGRHTITAGFEVPVDRTSGPPSIELHLPKVPVSSLALDLPGKKEVVITPGTSVQSRFDQGRTLAEANVPMASEIGVGWTEAVPEDIRAELRAHAAIYHGVHAEEGVLFLRALADVEVTRGATSTVRLAVPDSVQVNEVRALDSGLVVVEAGGASTATGGPGGVASHAEVVDWRLDEVAGDPGRELVIFLDRQLEGRLVLDVRYDRSLDSARFADARFADARFADARFAEARSADARASDSGEAAADALDLPLLRLLGAQRQRGMVALLSSREWVLEPVSTEQEGEASESAADATRVGENQLPAFVRQELGRESGLSVAHTFKYVESPPVLPVRASIPERKQGRFDVLVDTLVSLGEVTLEATASVEVDVKSGSLSEMRLRLPAGAHLLGLSGPSVRQHSIDEGSTDDEESGSVGGSAADPGAESTAGRTIEVAFTQEMEGQFRLDVSYEQILRDAADRVPVPLLVVEGAEVEQGRLAVEALSAVEVQPASTTELTQLDVAELPRDLVLRTTNPILHAYKYVGQGRRLDLEVTRHRVIDVQEAAIDLAHYRSLYTRDGLSVTHARFDMRNSREQFLRVRLPEGSKVWTAFVDGRPEKPARTEEDGELYLIRIIHSTQGFPVELVYQTPIDPIRGLGSVRGELPRPEILVTRSHWEVWVPSGVDYRRPRGSMERVSVGAAGSEADRSLAELGEAMEPLRLEVPRAGVRFVFEKLYANESDDAVGFELPYLTGWGRSLGQAGTVAGALLVWLGIGTIFRGRLRPGAALVVSGLAFLALLVQHYRVSPSPAIWLSIAVLVGLGGALIWRYRDLLRPGRRSSDWVDPEIV